jgi:hypothetical protein
VTNQFEEGADAAKESFDEGDKAVSDLQQSGGDIELKGKGGPQDSGGDIEFAGEGSGEGDEGTDSGGDIESEPGDPA